MEIRLVIIVVLNVKSIELFYVMMELLVLLFLSKSSFIVHFAPLVFCPRSHVNSRILNYINLV